MERSVNDLAVASRDPDLAIDAPRVSVIIIFFNAERFLDDAVQSVVDQTYGDWEMILVDDGSTDGSTAIAQRWVERRPGQVRYAEHPGHRNRGMSAARNLGLARARGEFVALLDADDIYLPEKLERQVALLDAHPEAALVFGAALLWFTWDPSRPESKEDQFREVQGFRDELVAAPQLVPLALRGKIDTPSTCGVLFRRRVAERVGGFDESFTGMFEDQVFFYKIFLVETVYVESGCWDRYRQHADSTTSKALKAGVYGGMNFDPFHERFLAWVERYLKEKEVNDRAVWAALRSAYGPYRSQTRRIVHIMIRHWQYSRLRSLGWVEAPAAVRRFATRATRRIRRAIPVRFGSLRRLEPVSRSFGFDRGTPVDRFYIDRFLDAHRALIRGRVLEIADDAYTRRFGGERVDKSDVLHIRNAHPGVTIVADLVDAPQIPADTFDCVIITQTLQLIFDVPAALRTLARILKPGGVALITLPGISQIEDDAWRDTWFWGFTGPSAQRLIGAAFPGGGVEVEVQGNVLAACAFLQGIAARELRESELLHYDPSYPVAIMVVATKAGGSTGA
jgi:glycosyltransferase involved in cell wall biosynthesis